MKYLLQAILVFAFANLFSTNTVAQCNNWNITAVNVKPSDCIANGSFTIQFSGPDVPNLSNIKFSIPLTQTVFFVQPNNSAAFANIPAGTYTVKVEAACGAGNVSKTILVTIGGSYIMPTLFASQKRGSLSCSSYGQITANVGGSSFPYTIKILSHPGAYTGATTFTTSATSRLLDSLPAGTYILQMVDTCGTATPTQSVNISSLNASLIPINPGGYSPMGITCNQVRLYKPNITLSNDPAWNGYYLADSLFQVAYSIDGGATMSPFERMDYKPFSVTLPSGKTYKDLYGSGYIYYIKPPCGPIFQVTGQFAQLTLQLTQISKCNSGFVEELFFTGALVCYPITVHLKNTTTNVSYGPYIYNGGSMSTPVLPYGTYDLVYTTADGFTATTQIVTTPPQSNPYYVTYYAELEGLNNYISGFTFYTSAGVFNNGTTIKLLSGPPGYAFEETVFGNPYNYVAYLNEAPVINNNLHFKPGTYTWQVKDACGTYILTSQVPQSQVYSYTLNLGNRQQTCNGLKVYPSGTASFNNSNWPVYFKILDGPPGYNTGIVSAGNALTLSTQGTYVIGISASPTDVFSYGALPNPYQVTDTIVYNHQSLTVDVNNTQGFLCIGASAGQGQIGIKGLGGMPFKFPSMHYNYYMAAAGNGLPGPYLSNNTTGFFAGMGMNAGDVYDLKIVDSCGAFVIHQVKILDLSTAQLASANAQDVCAGENLSLYALPLPGAVYSWTGPNGFSSNQQNPVINNISTAGTGQYTVTITTAYCTIPASSVVSIVVHPSPAKAVVTVSCVGNTAVLTANNIAGADYQWYNDGNILTGETGTTYTVTQAGGYTVHTVFPATGCSTTSDTIIFSAPPGTADIPAITASKTILCKDDTAFLSAVTVYPSTSYQWYLGGVPLTGATSAVYAATLAGNYTVKTSTGPCSFSTSAIFNVQKPIPPAIINPLGDTVFCEGGYVNLFGNPGTGLTYTWKRDGNIISLVSGYFFKATESGIYTVDVFNGYCTTTSNTVQVTVNERPVAAIAPAGDVYICEGDNIQLITPTGAGYHYTWLKNDTIIAGAITNAYTISAQGAYTVITANDKCPADTSSVNLYVVSYPLADITIEGPTEFCEGLTTALVLPYQNNCTYKWYKNGDVIGQAEGAEYIVSSSGVYKGEVSNHSCITRSKDVTIIVHPLPEPVITRKYQSLTTNVYATYQWYLNGLALSGNTGQDYKVLQPGYYTVAVTDSNGCTGMSDTADVVSLEEGCIVRLPTAFTPNNDGKNDIFRLVGFDEYTLKEFRVLNRWGQVVFSTNDKKRGWNGSYNNIPQEIGTYFYFVSYQCNNETQVRMRKGDVLLTR